MAVKIGINGFGRIGRLVFRAAVNDSRFQIVAVNDLTDAATLAYLTKYDSIHRTLPVPVEAKGDVLVVDGRETRVLSQRDPAELPWKDMGVEVVIESTGRFRDRASASKHIDAGARKVLISAPAKEPDITVVMGVNHESLDPKSHHVVSVASCTTNCLAPVAKVLHESFGIERGIMTTIHSYTNDQVVLDFPHKDLRRARAAAVSMIPTTTGAAKAVSLVLPELAGRLTGMAVRVPVANGSLVDFVTELSRGASAEDVNRALREASERPPLKGYLRYTEDPIVSVDIIGDSHSSIVDGASTMVIQDRMVKVLSWYDNEWGYANRLLDVASQIMG